MLTIETLARFQFGMTTIFHFFFVNIDDLYYGSIVC